VIGRSLGTRLSRTVFEREVLEWCLRWKAGAVVCSLAECFRGLIHDLKVLERLAGDSAEKATEGKEGEE
jgi:hypothetical protein